MKKKILIILIISILFLIAWFILGKGYLSFNIAFDFSLPIGSQFEKYSGNNFSFEYPNNWKILSNNNKIIISGPNNSNEFYITINLQVLTNEIYSSKEEVAGDLSSQILNYDSKASIKNNILTNLGNETAGQFDVYYNLKGQSQKARYVIAEHNSKFYVLSFQSPAELFNKYINLFEHTKNSFKFSSQKKMASPTISCGTIMELINLTDIYDGVNFEGITWDGNYIWLSKEEPRNSVWGDAFYKITNSGKIMSSFWVKLKGSYPTNGNYFWLVYSNPDASYYYKLNPNTQNYTYIFNITSIPYIYGLTFDGNYLWASSYSKIYKINSLGNIIKIINEKANSLAWANNYLWAHYGNKIKKINPNSGIIEANLDIKYGCNDLAFDGNYLLCLDSYNPYIYKININNC